MMRPHSLKEEEVLKGIQVCRTKNVHYIINISYDCEPLLRGVNFPGSWRDPSVYDRLLVTAYYEDLQPRRTRDDPGFPCSDVSRGVIGVVEISFDAVGAEGGSCHDWGFGLGAAGRKGCPLVARTAAG